MTYKDPERKKETDRRSQYRNLYGITIADYDSMLEEQLDSCGICGTHQSLLAKRLHVDHCHDTNKVRGLLCSNCNLAFGLFKDNLDTIQRAINLLKGLPNEKM